MSIAGLFFHTPLHPNCWTVLLYFCIRRLKPRFKLTAKGEESCRSLLCNSSTMQARSCGKASVPSTAAGYIMANSRSAPGDEQRSPKTAKCIFPSGGRAVNITWFTLRRTPVALKRAFSKTDLQPNELFMNLWFPQRREGWKFMGNSLQAQQRCSGRRAAASAAFALSRMSGAGWTFKLPHGK